MTESAQSQSPLEVAIAAAQRLSDEDARILQASLLWDVEDVAVAKAKISEVPPVMPREGLMPPALTDEQRDQLRYSEVDVEVRAGSAIPDGWKGTPPAEGTRRRLILDTILEEDVLSASEALEFADAIESALLQTTIDEEAMDRGAETLTEGVRSICPEDSLEKYCAAQAASHHRLRGDDPEFVEYHRGAEIAYSLVLKRLSREPDPDDPIASAVLDQMEIPRFSHRRQNWDIGQRVRELADRHIAATEKLRDLGQDREAELPSPSGPSLAGEEAERALHHLINARQHSVNGEELERLNHAITAAHMVIEPPSDPAKERELRVPEKDRCDGSDEPLGGAVDLRPPDEWDIGQAARERLHERLTDGPIPNPAELARVIDILR